MSQFYEPKLVNVGEFVCEGGGRLHNVEVAYETYGSLNKDRSNAILVCHALSGSAHAAGKDKNGNMGWFNPLIGPGKALDTNRYFVICSNVLGSCFGTTGPSSLDENNKHYAMRFPVITITDMVKVEKLLIDKLGIKRLVTVIGGSMGGMQALKWAVLYPDSVISAIPMASPAYSSPRAIAFNKIGRDIIMNDPKWANGDYYGTEGPVEGLALARMVGHITYLSFESMNKKFGRAICRGSDIFDLTEGKFEVERYLFHNGFKFTRNFDPNSYLYITRALDLFDIRRNYSGLEDALGRITAKMLLISFSTDELYLPGETELIYKTMKRLGKDVSYFNIESDSGHDSFLIEYDRFQGVVRDFLKNLRY